MECANLYNYVKTLFKQCSVDHYEIVYPPRWESRSVDFIVRKGNRAVIVRVTDRVSTRRKDFIELKRMSELLEVNSLVVTSEFNREEVLDGVVYMRGRIAILSANTLEEHLKGGKVFIYEYKGTYYVKIDGQKLRRLRERLGLSLHRLAQKLGVSAKALYRYEQGSMDMSVETAERFANVLGELFEYIVEGIDVFEERVGIEGERRSTAELSIKGDDDRAKLVLKVKNMGMDAEVFDNAPPDIIVKGGSKYVSLLVFMRKWSDLSNVEMRFVESSKIARSVGGRTLIVVDKDVERSSIKELERIADVRRVDEVLNELKYLSKR